jgi:hypothetical protein
MAEHHGGGNPITGLLGMLVGSVTSVYGAIFLIGLAMGAITGNVPIRGSLLNPWETGQYVGGLFNAGGNSGVQTFGDKTYFENSKKINSDAKPDQKLMSPNRTPSTILPTSAKTTNDASVVEQSQPTAIALYEDSNGDGIITPEEIAAQNKARSAKQ